MASDAIWAKVRHFKRNENWGGFPPRDTPEARERGAEVISGELLLEADRLREVIGTPILVTCAVDTEGHVKNSYHYKGLAMDVVMPELKMSDLDIILIVKDMKFRGIGYYPFWQWKGKMVGGFHLDMRPLVGKFKRATWMGVPKRLVTGNPNDRGQSYVALNAYNYFDYCE